MKDTSVRLTWYNPACNLKDFPGDVGLGIDIPVNNINRALLGNPERFERDADSNTREFENFTVRYGGKLLMGGTLIVDSASHEKYNCRLRSDVGNIGKEYREKYITDSISFNEEKTFVNKADYDPMTDPYGCPRIYNPDFFKEKGEKGIVTRWGLNPNFMKTVWSFLGFLPQTDVRQYIVVDEQETEDFTEAFLQSSGWMVNDKNPDGTIRTPTTQTKADFDSIAGSDPEKDPLDVAVVSPMLFLNYLLKTLFKDAGFAIGDSFIADNPDLRKLIVYHNYDITQFRFLPEDRPLRESTRIRYSRERSLWYDIAMGYSVGYIERHVNDNFQYKDLLPKIELKNFILGTGNLLNVFPHFRPGRKIVDIIDRESIITGGYIDVEKYLSGFWMMEDEKDLALKFAWEHDDNDQIFQEGWEDIDDYRDKQQETVDTWDDLPDTRRSIPPPMMDEVRYVRETNSYVQYKLWEKEWIDEDGTTHQDKYIGWNHLTIGFQNGYLNRGKEEEEEIETKFSTVSVSKTTVEDDGIEYPHVKQKGNIRTDVFPYESFSPRMLFYMGNNEGNNETANISLDWEKEDTGLLDSRWRNWSRFWSTRQKVECEAHFPIGMIDYVIRNIYKKFRGREGEFIIEEMETEFGLNTIGTTKIRGYKLNYAPRIWQMDDMWKLDQAIWIDESIDMTLNFQG